nr:heme ABC exporter ATP-binding protein CcmA [Tsuneonella mangrovi]
MQATGLTAWELFCRRGDRLLFGSLDLWLDKGAALHLVGPNGVGKSSLLQILAGLRKPSFAPELSKVCDGYGIVNWQGTVGLLNERHALDPELPLGQALSFWSKLDGCTTDIATTGLAGLEDVPVRYLSTGQKKRAALARLLGQGADHWLLDEPLNGLDSAGVELVEHIIAERRKSGGVVVVASHQPITLPDCQTIDLRDHPW